MITCSGPSGSGGTANGLSSQALSSRCVNRFMRSSATRLDIDQPQRDLSWIKRSITIVINVVHTWVFTAVGDVPTNVLIFRFCFSALKKSYRVRDWRGIRGDPRPVFNPSP